MINGVIEDRSALQPKIIPFPRLDSDPLEYLMEVMLMMTMMMNDDGDHKGNESDDGEMMMKVMMMTMKVMMLKMIYDHSIRKPTIFRWGQYVDRLTQDADKAFSC